MPIDLFEITARYSNHDASLRVAVIDSEKLRGMAAQKGA
jgi:hypothetical protein